MKYLLKVAWILLKFVLYGNAYIMQGLIRLLFEGCYFIWHLQRMDEEFVRSMFGTYFMSTTDDDNMCYRTFWDAVNGKKTPYDNSDYEK